MGGPDSCTIFHILATPCALRGCAVEQYRIIAQKSLRALLESFGAFFSGGNRAARCHNCKLRTCRDWKRSGGGWPWNLHAGFAALGVWAFNMTMKGSRYSALVELGSKSHIYKIYVYIYIYIYMHIYAVYVSSPFVFPLWNG